MLKGIPVAPPVFVKREMSVQKPRLNARRPRPHHRPFHFSEISFYLSSRSVPSRSNLNPPHGSFPLFSSSLSPNIYDRFFFFLIGWIGLEKRENFFSFFDSLVQWMKPSDFRRHFGFIRFPMSTKGRQLTRNMCHTLSIVRDDCFKCIWFRFAFAVRIILFRIHVSENWLW